MHGFGKVIEAFGGAGIFADAIGIAASHARTMKARNSIPVAYWPTVIAEAEKRRIRISYDLLASLAAARRAASAPRKASR